MASKVGPAEMDMHQKMMAAKGADAGETWIRKMIEQELYELPVLSYQELTQDINIQPLARVEL